VVFLGSSCRETAKNAIKKIDGKDERKKVLFLFSHFFQPEVLDMRGFSPKIFFMVFFRTPLVEKDTKTP
jgi:hypothetical protein